MGLGNQKILIAIVVVTLLLFPEVAFNTGALLVVLGLLFVIFFPGYTLLSALFPKRDDLGGVERLALSLGLSIAVVPLIGLILNYTPWGIKLYPILISVTLFIIVTSAVGWYRQRKLPASDRFGITFKASLPNWVDMSKLDKALSISLVVAIMAALGCLGYVVAMPKQGEKFTEFYILGLGGKAEDYPQQVILGDTVGIIVGVVNHEHQPASYQVGITIDGVETSQVDIGTLAHEEKCEKRVSFIPKVAGKKQKVDFYLHKNGEDRPYFDDPLHLYIDVVTFYVLNSEGKAGEYLQQVKQGEPVELIIGVVNDEPQPTNYRVKIKTADILYKEINTGTLAHLENWQQKVSFVPWVQKEKQKLDLWLYKGDETQPCLETAVSIDINMAIYPRYVIAKLPEGNRFTEFYILNTDGKTDAYPWQVRQGEPVEVIVGIVNHEYEMASYRLEIKLNGICVKEISTETLTHQDKWEEKVSFAPPIWTWGEERKAEFWLYKNGQAEPYYKEPLYFYIKEPLYFYIDVIP
jgi:uncharacterized membrane protein